MTQPQPLSHDAQAIWDALDMGDLNGPQQLVALAHAAAALQAVVDQVISSVPPPCADFDERAKGFLAAHVKYRRELLAIAAELEGSDA